MSTASGAPRSSENSDMLSRDQLFYLFSRFSFLTSQPDVKKRIADAVKDKQEAVAITTAIQEEILTEMGIGTAWPVNFFSRQFHELDIPWKVIHNLSKEAGLLPGWNIGFDSSLGDPRYGIACLGKVNSVFENDKDLMIQFYRFVAKEEMAIDEAELESDEFAEKMHNQQKLQEQQLEMLMYIRKFHPDDQSTVLEALHKQMENAKFANSGAFLTTDQIQEIVRRRSAPFPDTSRLKVVGHHG